MSEGLHLKEQSLDGNYVWLAIEFHICNCYVSADSLKKNFLNKLIAQ